MDGFVLKDEGNVGIDGVASATGAQQIGTANIPRRDNVGAVAEGNAGHSQTPRFRLRTLEEMASRAPTAQWLIEGVLIEGAIANLFGCEGSYKSLLVMGWAVAIASGRAWEGRQVRQGGIVWLASEGSGGLQQRRDAYASELGLSDPSKLPILGFDDPPDLRNSEDVEQIIDEIKRWQKDTRQRVALVVVDTISGHFGDGDENEAKDMNALLRGLVRLHEEIGRPHVLPIGHPGWADATREKGSRNLRIRADYTMRMERPGRGPRARLSLAKPPRDGKPFEPIELREKITASGVPILVCDSVQNAIKSVRNRSLTQRQQLALDVIQTLQSASYSEWEAAWIKADPDNKPGSFSAITKALLNRGLVEHSGGMWFVIAPPEDDLHEMT